MKTIAERIIFMLMTLGSFIGLVWLGYFMYMIWVLSYFPEPFDLVGAFCFVIIIYWQIKWIILGD